MLSTIFYWIIGPAILAFFLGFSAHALKMMTTPEQGGSSSGNQNADNSTAGITAVESTTDHAEAAATVVS